MTPSYFKIFLSLWLIPVASLWAECNSRSELEVVYCNVKAKGHRGLPSLAEFRRNTPIMQSLLLKRPAAKYAITIPANAGRRTAAATNAAAVSRSRYTASGRVPEPEIKKVRIKKSIKTSNRKNPVRQKRVAVPNRALTWRSQCRLQGIKIACKNLGFEYTLLNNRLNRYLDPQVFSPEHVMGLRSYAGALSDRENVHRYLGDSYRRYIQAMLDIGLAASTISYSRFYYTFDDAVKNQRDFAARFEKMYIYLKKDKQTMGVKGRYSDELPVSLKQCSWLNDSLLVCDNDKLNWIYKKSS